MIGLNKRLQFGGNYFFTKIKITIHIFLILCEAIFFKRSDLIYHCSLLIPMIYIVYNRFYNKSQVV